MPDDRGPPRSIARPFLAAEWRELAMLNYAVAPDLLRPFVPRGTELDAWRGTTYVSIVGFRFVSTRVLGVSIPGHVDFDEVNLRFYVRRRDGHEWKRGVVFMRELVPRRAIAWLARAWYNEPYRALPMRNVIERENGIPRRVRYEWQQDTAWEGISLDTHGDAQPLTTGSEEEFITEHYWGYTRQRDGSTVEYEVDHPRWSVWQAREARLTCDVAALYGDAFVPCLTREPHSAFLADGSPIVVGRPTQIIP